ncbi:MAG: hypothetical protein GX159_09425 [Flavobacteriaceae bacterium]|jgi:hypothetical protein|nr:hypothetical protein [Flavobacteriaceae bacterium]
MKNLLTILCLIASLFAYTQEREVWGTEVPKSLDKKPHSGRYTPREVEKMAILKECKSVDENNKSELQLCLADEFRNKISQKFSEFDKIADGLQLSESTIKIFFVLSKEGEIKDIKTYDFGSKELSAFCAEALENLNSKIQFEPAQIDGEKVDLVFQLPVKYIRNRE